MSPLGLDPVHRWARSENQDPTQSYEFLWNIEGEFCILEEFIINIFIVKIDIIWGGGGKFLF